MVYQRNSTMPMLMTLQISNMASKEFLEMSQTIE